MVQVIKSLQDPLEVRNNLPRIDDNVRERGLEQKCFTIRDAVLTCARKPTRVSLIYRTESSTKKSKTEKKLKSKKTDMLRSNSKQQTTISEEIILQLIMSKCLPILLYCSEVCQLTKSDLNSLNFAINRFYESFQNQ